MSMVRMCQFKVSLTALMLSVLLGAIADADRVQAQDNSPAGCWEDVKGVVGDPIARLCFRRDGSIGPILTGRSDGKDWGVWKQSEGNALSLHLDSSTEEVICKFNVSAGLRLTLTECTNSRYSREFVHLSNAVGAAAERYLGCWMWQQHHGRYVSGLSLCFYEGGKLHGVDVDNNHGADFGGTWSVPGLDELQLYLGEPPQKCSAKIIEDPKALVLTACKDPKLTNTYKKLPD